MDIELECCCGNPDCKQSVFIRKGAVFYEDESKNHWNQGYINVHGFEGGLPEVMLDPDKMRELRDFLNEVYPDTCPTCGAEGCCNAEHIACPDD